MKNRLILLGALICGIVYFTITWMNDSGPAREIRAEYGEEEEGNLEQKKEARMAKFEQEIAMTKDPKLGYVPYERRLVAKDYIDKLIDRQKKQRGAIAGINWQNMGPNNVGGRTRAIMFDPNDVTNKRVFAGAASGGLWKNDDVTNVNSSWTKINDFLDNLTVNSLAVDPMSMTTFYAGTGEAYSQVTPGMGLFKSTNGGSTWSAVANTSQFKYISEVLLRVESGISVIYLACKRVYPGPELEDNPGMNYYFGLGGLFRSANDGASWTQVIPDNDGMTTPTVDDIGLDVSGNLWASTGQNDYNHFGGDIYKCTDGTCDVPGDFTKMYDASANGFVNVQRTVIALAPSDVNTIYAVAAKTNGNEDVAYLVKSVDGGANWSASLPIPPNYNLATCAVVPSTHFTRSQATYDLVMTVHPSNPSLVLIGGVDMFRTLDGFANTTHVGSWYQGVAPCDQVIHADHHAIVFRPGSSNEVAFGNDGGVFFSTNAGNSAATPTFAHHVKDYNVSQLYAADLSPGTGTAEYIGGLQDNGTQDWDAGNPTTTEANGGDGGFCHIDQNEPNIQISAYTYNDFGITINEWTTPYIQVSPTNGNGRFINPTDYDDANNILYSASQPDSICRVLNIGTTNDITDKIPIGGDALGGKKATTFRVDKNTVTTLYVGNDNGKVYRILNANGGGLTSTSISNGLPAQTWVSSIDVEAGNSNHMLVTLSNFGVVSVWESTDGGANWNSVEGNLPDIPVRWGIFSPINNDQAILATDMGAWSTDNLNGASTNWGLRIRAWPTYGLICCERVYPIAPL
ncbi:MAG: hypothetical protein IPL46_16420 [Saprospiraceae bacterium]|nr:hypothetical protein [Saprospiraceae bacterium]